MAAVQAVLAAGILLGCLRATAAAGDPGSSPLASVEAGIRFFAPLILPKALQDAHHLRAFVCGPDFAAVRRDRGDRAAVDTLFGHALKLSLGSRAEALLLAMLVTMDHRRVAFSLPLLGPMLVLPLTSEFEEEFALRLAALPVRLYDDTPPTAAGDRDKLQHFFGSAFLAYVFESGEQADAVGRMVEQGERRYVPGERVDPRDLRANRQGQRFALALLGGRTDPPSAYLAVTMPADEQTADP